ncbi:hypothetical protein U1Q18_003027 [Sarracenia purpurea var. burkii]
MDEYSGKRGVGGLVTSRKGSGLVLRETSGSRERDSQFCNRVACNGRLKSVQSGCSEKFKSSRPSFQTSNGKEIIGSSTGNCSLVTNTRKSHQVQKRLSLQLGTDSFETNSIEEGFDSELNEVESRKVGLMEVGSSNVASNSRPQKVFRHKSGLGTRDTELGSSVPLSCESTCHGGRNASKYCLKNLRCKSISDVIPSGCSSSESNLNRRKDVVQKGNPELASSSSSRGKKMSGPLSEDSYRSASINAISISDSGRARTWPPSRDNGVGSVRTRRSIYGNSRTRLCCNQGNGSSLVPVDLPVVTPQVPQPEITIGLDVTSSSHQFLAEASSSRLPPCTHPGGSGGNLAGIMPFCPSELGVTHPINRDGLQRYNIDGIAEVLLALERIEQDEELSYEQLLALETNLLLGGLGFYDQHRDMRLDIDNMSYEELLALEEKMGTVSTAVSEDALSKCLKRSIHQPVPPKQQTVGCSRDEDDIKCSICQEEYLVGDEVGSLKCDHRYHVACIHQWLQLKNWCPICKSSAAPSRSSSPS